MVQVIVVLLCSFLPWSIATVFRPTSPLLTSVPIESSLVDAHEQERTRGTGDGDAYSNLAGSVNVDENQSGSSVIFTPAASSSIPATITFAMTSSVSGAPFSIDPGTGDVSVLASPLLDFESLPAYTLTVSADDGDGPVTGVLTVNVQDVNEPPTFGNLPASVDVNEDDAGGRTLVTVLATDPEAVSLTFTCTPAPDDGNFVGSCSGNSDIILKAGPTLSYGTTQSYAITVTASDGVESASSLFTVVVQDTVNESPTFTNLPDSVQIPEDTATGPAFFQAAAVDPDLNAVTFNLVDILPQSGLDKIGVRPNSGRVYLKKQVDFETEPILYEVMVDVCDTNSACNSAKLTVGITDANDPHVASVTNQVSILENATVGTETAVTYQIIDPDGEVNFIFSLLNYGHSSYVTIVSNTGALRLAKTLDYEDTVNFPDQQLELKISVSDTAGISSEIFLNVSIEDVNEFTPTFGQPSYVADVDENAPLRTSVLMFNSSDQDLGPVYGAVSYFVQEPYFEHFFVTHYPDGTAILRIKKPFDREAMDTGTISLVLRVVDGGKLFSDATVELTINDINEGTPIITSTAHAFTVRADAAPSVIVGQLTASDGDAMGSPVHFVQVNATANDTSFLVGYLDGSIVVNGPLARDTTYHLLIAAEDEGVPPSQSEPVSVRVDTFDPVGYLTSWTLNTGGAYVGKYRVATFERKLGETCAPCRVQVAEVLEGHDSDHYVLMVSIMKGGVPEDPNEPLTFMSKEEILEKYTEDGVSLPNALAKSAAPPGLEVVSVVESLETPPYSWLTHTAPGLVVLALLILLGVAVVLAVLVLLLDHVWYTRRPQHRQFYYDLNRQKEHDVAQGKAFQQQPQHTHRQPPRSATTITDIHADLPGTPKL